MRYFYTSLQTLLQNELKKDPNFTVIPIIRQNKSLKPVVGEWVTARKKMGRKWLIW